VSRSIELPSICEDGSDNDQGVVGKD